ncbi:MAG: murein L,D-transpeptidase family protein [Bacteroidia bacterium]
MKINLSPLFVPAMFCLFAFHSGADSFRKTQLKAPKVQVAYQEKWPIIKQKLQTLHVDTGQLRVFIRVFKQEKITELWVRSGGDKKFQLYASYPVCASSGDLGPKRRQGDGQVPEGFYTISVFNPYSNYYVSLGLDYPNKADRIAGGKGDLGGAIMIHGNCVTIGCIPLTDEVIKEVYVLAAEARNTGQADIPVHVFPVMMNTEKMQVLEKSFTLRPDLLKFWKNLETGYDYFEKGKTLPQVSVSAEGTYLFK